MQIFNQLEELPAGLGATVVSVGNFDGVHRAHQLVLREVVLRARELRSKAVAVTFVPHPVRILRPELAPKMITPLAVKLKLLEKTGIDAVLAIPFTSQFSLTSPRQFAERILRDRLHAREVHEGANFHFGHKAEGNVQKLTEIGGGCGFEVKVYPELKMGGDVVSSSHIRDLLQAGEVGRARRLLGRSFSISATPERGRGYGRQYTVPTVNLARYEDLTPGHGVYITRTTVAEQCFDSVTNVGTRPTFGGDSFAIETHLLNFHPLELTPETPVEIFFFRRLRDEIKFPSIETLRSQIGEDVQRAQQFFHRLAGNGQTVKAR